VNVQVTDACARHVTARPAGGFRRFVAGVRLVGPVGRSLLLTSNPNWSRPYRGRESRVPRRYSRSNRRCTRQRPRAADLFHIRNSNYSGGLL